MIAGEKDDVPSRPESASSRLLAGCCGRETGGTAAMPVSKRGVRRRRPEIQRGKAFASRPASGRFSGFVLLVFVGG